MVEVKPELPDTVKEEIDVEAVNEVPLPKDEINLEIDIAETRCYDALDPVTTNVFNDKEL